MKVKYDFHIHSGLSPCAENDMTPCNIVGFAKLNDLDMIAIADHNSIGNIETAQKIGESFGVTVVPGIELQTAEDIHILCLFEGIEGLKGFYDSIEFIDIKNKPDIFGNQLLFDEEDQIIGEETRLLLNASKISCTDVKELADRFNGIAIPAHIDRDENGMIAILGCVTKEFNVVELSKRVTKSEIESYRKKYKVIIDSDAHTLLDIANGEGENVLELPENSAKALIKYLKS